MLMNFSCYYHIWQTVPDINQISFAIQTNLPSVGPRTHWQHRKRIAKLMLSHPELNIVRGPGPYELVVDVPECDSVMASENRLVNLHYKPNCDGSESREDVRLVLARLRDLPTDESSFQSRPAVFMLSRLVAGCHDTFICSQDGSCRAGFSNSTTIDPEDPFAEPANLIHLMADKYNCASSFRNVSHFTQAFLLE